MGRESWTPCPDSPAPPSRSSCVEGSVLLLAFHSQIFSKSLLDWHWKQVKNKTYYFNTEYVTSCLCESWKWLNETEWVTMKVVIVQGGVHASAFHTPTQYRHICRSYDKVWMLFSHCVLYTARDGICASLSLSVPLRHKPLKGVWMLKTDVLLFDANSHCTAQNDYRVCHGPAVHGGLPRWLIDSVRNTSSLITFCFLFVFTGNKDCPQ